MDVYPDVAVDLDYIKAGGILDRVTGALLDFSRRRADGILALGHCMRRRLMARGISGTSIHVADNWADGKSIQPVPRITQSGSLALLYSGNLGLAHDVDTMSEAIAQMADDSRFQFVFAGGGPLRPSFEAQCAKLNLSTVQFRSYSRRESLGSSLGNCDIGLITQRKSCLGSVVPSKVYGLLAAARPILFIGPAQSTVAEIINRFQCGWQIENGDSAGLISLLKLLVEEPLLIEASGKRARQAFEKYFDLPLGVGRICSLVEDSTNQPLEEAASASNPVRDMSAV
jgi:glycosyltransferase involved in cell wall biosynthesis